MKSVLLYFAAPGVKVWSCRHSVFFLVFFFTVLMLSVVWTQRSSLYLLQTESLPVLALISTSVNVEAGGLSNSNPDSISILSVVQPVAHSANMTDALDYVGKEGGKKLRLRAAGWHDCDMHGTLIALWTVSPSSRLFFQDRWVRLKSRRRHDGEAHQAPWVMRRCIKWFWQTKSFKCI